MVSPQRHTVVLTGAGALPFYLLQLPLIDEGMRLFAFIAYGAVIASFMAGTLWGLVQSAQRSPAAMPVLVISNVLALIAWATMLMPAGLWALGLQALSFLGLLAADRFLASGALEKPWYFTLRLSVTLLVLFAYGLALITFG
jgi:hypothetical protein